MDLTHIHYSGQSCYQVRPYGRDRSYVVFEEFLEKYELTKGMLWQNLVDNKSLLPYDESLALELGSMLDRAVGLEAKAKSIRAEIREIFKQRRGG